MVNSLCVRACAASGHSLTDHLATEVNNGSIYHFNPTTFNLPFYKITFSDGCWKLFRVCFDRIPLLCKRLSGFFFSILFFFSFSLIRYVSSTRSIVVPWRQVSGPSCSFRRGLKTPSRTPPKSTWQRIMGAAIGGNTLWTVKIFSIMHCNPSFTAEKSWEIFLLRKIDVCTFSPKIMIKFDKTVMISRE